MGRLHLIELHDRAGFPAVWRELLTDYLSFFAARFRPYAVVAPLLSRALRMAGTAKIVDLCSGAGQPIVSIASDLRANGVPEQEIILTDKYPHLAAWARLGSRISFEPEPVDAVDVPAHLDGFRTLFTSFHHFPPEAARAVLADAAAKRQGIGIFEYTERNLLRWAVPVCLIPLFVWICAPFIRPFRWQRLVWTYLVPIIPIVALWDGLVSCLRTYSIEELRILVETVDEAGCLWEIGRLPSVGFSRVTYLIGLPRRAVGPRRQEEPGVAEHEECEGA